MTTEQTNEPAKQKPLRLWPGVIAVVLQWLAWLVLPIVIPDAKLYGLLGGVLGGGVVIIIWWLFFSRALWVERVSALVLMGVALFATSYLVDKSIANAGMGMMLFIFAIPVLCLALVTWAVGSRYLPSGTRLVTLAASILMACGVFTLLRTGGINGDGESDLHWRWTPTPEERLLAQANIEAASVPANPSTTKTSAAWPGFRGAERDGVVRGVQITTDWSRLPPVELWRKPIGPGWSSFAVNGDFLYTQEQRGEEEMVTCYTVSTGQPVWKHRDVARFWESNGGAGPRATPTYSNDRIYALGATGILNVLDAGNGTVIWSRNAASDTGAKNPGWGFAGSPLVINDLVIVAASGRLVAYDVATGQQRWLGPTGGAGYSSPHLATIDGVAQIILLRGARTTSVAPASGSLLWEHSWQAGVSILQPAVIVNGEVLIAASDEMGGIGIRRLAVAHGAAGWTVQERWTSRGLKPYFSDFVVHQGHAFGFDGSVLACIDLADGKRKWKGGRFGQGQLVLLPEQDVLLVLSEDGVLALVKATPGQFTELARFPAFQGKTWNHPVLVGDVLLIRNGEEMAAFRLPLASARINEK